MAIRYRLVKSRDPRTGTPGWRASAIRTDPVDRRELVKLIASKTTVSAGDVAAVLAELADALQEQFANGRAVMLEGIGSLYPRLDCRLVTTPEAFNPRGDIKGVVIRFRSSADLKEATRNFKIRAALEGASQGEAPTETPSKDGDDEDPA